jgi:hypothetical protein
MATSSERTRQGEEYRAELATTDADDLGVAIAEGVAAVTGEDPTSSAFRVHDYLDVDALERLYGAGSEDWKIEAEVAGATVTVRGDQTLTVA